MFNPLSILTNSLAVVVYIYNTCEAVKQNKEECKRFCDHANLVLNAIKSRCNGDLPPNVVIKLVDLQRAIEEIRAAVRGLSKRSFIKRVILHEDLSLRIRRAYNEMNRAIHVFSLGAIIDMAALKEVSDTARQMDRQNLDKRCERALRNSRGDHDILEQLQIRQEEMQQALVSIRNVCDLLRHSSLELDNLRRKKRLPKVQSTPQRQILESGLHALERQATRKHNLPDEFVITTLDIIIHRDLKLGQGGFAKVFQADWQGTRVAVKELERGIPASVIEQEINIWRRLHHPHIVQFYGACSISDPPFMVCALKANGNANEYFAKFPCANRCKVLHEASLGLMYLHQQGVVHGDLKGSNILIDEFGKACLSDFGLAKIKTYSTTIRNVPHTDGTLRWMAPEQLRTGLITKQSDMYGFAMTMYEIYSSQPPFVGCPDTAVMDNVHHGFRPPNLLSSPGPVQRGLNAGIWSIVEECWRQQPERRPSATVVSERLSYLTVESKKKIRKPYSAGDLRGGLQRRRLVRRVSNIQLPVVRFSPKPEVCAKPKTLPPVPHHALLPVTQQGKGTYRVLYPGAAVVTPQVIISPPPMPRRFNQDPKQGGAFGLPRIKGKVLAKGSPSSPTQSQCVIM